MRRWLAWVHQQWPSKVGCATQEGYSAAGLQWILEGGRCYVETGHIHMRSTLHRQVASQTAALPQG